MAELKKVDISYNLFSKEKNHKMCFLHLVILYFYISKVGYPLGPIFHLTHSVLSSMFAFKVSTNVCDFITSKLKGINPSLGSVPLYACFPSI